MAFELKTIAVSKIYLDPENPRHESLPDEASIVRYLVANEGVRAIAKDIAEAESLSPLEPLAVIKHSRVKTGFTVVEGNRRICSLKLLIDPGKAATENDRKYFASLAKGMERKVTRVQAVVFDSRDAAIRWFALRHRGEQDGVGTKGWDTNQIARFNLRTGARDPNLQALHLIDYAQRRGLLNAAEIESLNITTLTRYLSTPVFRHALGLVNRNSIEINVPDNEFERALKRFLIDSLDPLTGVNSRTTADDRKTYASRLGQEGAAAVNHGRFIHLPGEDREETSVTEPTNQSGKSTDDNSEKNGEKSIGLGRDSSNPDKRRRVVAPTFTARIKDKILRRLYRELKGIDVIDFTVAATALFRSVLEKSTTLYLSSVGTTPDPKLDEKLKQLSKQLQAEGFRDRELKFLRNIATNGKDGDFAPDTLGHYIHGGAIPTPTYVCRYWDNMEHVLRHTLNKV